MSDDLASAISRVVEQRADAALECLRALLRASRDGEEATQQEVERRLAALGMQPRMIRAAGATIATSGEFCAPEDIDPAERASVVGRGGGDPERALLLWAHPDGMPFDGGAGWTRDPHAGELADGRIYGWGIADDLSGVATLLMVPEILAAASVTLAGDLVVASTPSKGHASGVLAVLGAGVSATAGIYLHPAESGNGLGDIKALAPGILRFRLRVDGAPPPTAEPNHTLWSHLGTDPLPKLLAILGRLQDLAWRLAVDHRTPAIEELTGRSSGMLVTQLRAGESPSRLPREAEATVSFALPPGASLGQLRSEVERVLWEEGQRDGWLREHPPAVEWLFGTTAAQVPADHPLYQTVLGAIEQVTGAAPRYYAGHTASEIRQPILNHGIPCVGIGPRCGSLTQAGGTDEWLDVQDYLRMIAACALAAARWCGVRR